MNIVSIPNSFLFAGIIIASMSFAGQTVTHAQDRPGAVKPLTTIPGPGDDTRNIMVKFGDGLRVTIGESGYPLDRLGKGLRSAQALSRLQVMAASGAQWRRMSGISEEETERLRETAEMNLNRNIGRLNNYCIVHLPADADPVEWIDALNALVDVEMAWFVPRPPPLPLPGSFQSRQGYLNAATNGIDAGYAWGIGDSGQGVTICDFEYWWNLSHQDLPPVTQLIPSGLTPVSVGPGDTAHGTAVLGELASMNNGWGTTGAAYGSNIAVAYTNFSTWGWDIGVAMTNAMAVLSPGDVFLVEQQYAGPKYNWITLADSGLIPIEWWRPWYDVVVTAVGNGFHVVEAAGNGYEDLDSAIYATGNGGHWPYLPLNNSGAIMVGAGAAPAAFYGTDVARSRLAFSNYGSRLDLQAWGEAVVTTGFNGNLWNSEGINLYYDSSFSGTSSASPIVAAAVALVESRFESVYGGTMAPATMRSILRNTGSAQQAGTFPVSQNIGPMPDLNSALNFSAHTLAGGTYQVGLSRTYTYLTSVADTLREKILLGNVTFELMSDYTSGGETYPIVIPQYSTAGGTFSVTIRPASGVTSRTTAGSPPPFQPLIHLNGADRVTLDGRPGGTGSGDWLIRNSRTDSTGPAILFANGADDNTLRYLKIESQCSTATYGTVSFGWNSDSLGNRRNRVEYNDIGHRTDNGKFPMVAVNSLSIVNAPNDSNEIVGNGIHDWASAGAVLNGERWTLDSNSFYSVSPQSYGLTGVQVFLGNGHSIRDNDIGGTAPGSSGSPLTTLGNFPFTGITLTVDTLAQTAVERNIIRNIMSASSGPANFFGITCYTMGKVRIADNIIGDTAAPSGVWLSGTGVAGGIDIAFIQGAEIEGNTIVNVRQAFTAPGQVRCISINSPNIFSVKKNLIHSVGPTKPGVPGLVSGIYLDNFIDSVLIANNMVSLGFGDSNDCAYYGIYDISTSGTIKVDASHNSIAIGGISSGGVSSAGLIHTGGSIITFKNNAVMNVRSGISSFHHALYNFSPGWLPGASDFNVLKNLNPAHLTQFMGTNLTLAGWQSMSGGDLASINDDPRFVGQASGDLHIDPSVWSPCDNAGTSLPTVTDDFDGVARGGAPDIGADEYTISAPAAFLMLSPPNGAADRPVSDTLRWSSTAAAGFYDVYLDTLTPPTTIVGSNLTDTLFAYGPIDTNRTYYWSVTGKNSSGATGATGAPWSFTTGPVSGLITRDYPYDSSWNMLSVPLYVDDSSGSALYPSALSKAFIYTGSYQTRDTLGTGMGFWVKFGAPGSASMSGYRCDPETVDVATGWNIVGSITDAVTVSSIISIPGGIATSAFYGYSDGYFTADTILPGRGYWLKASQAGKIVLTTDTASVAPSAMIRIVPGDERPPDPPRGGEFATGLENGVPTEYGLDQNYPNPFNGTTAIRYRLPEESRVSIAIYDLLGRRVSVLVDRIESAGEHLVFWSPGETVKGPMITGVYYYRINASGMLDPGKIYSRTRKILLIK